MRPTLPLLAVVVLVQLSLVPPASGFLEASVPPVIPSLVQGIGPGSPIKLPGGAFCSTSFLLKEPDVDQYYLSTAGHCLARNHGATLPPSTGATNPDALVAWVEVCYANCTGPGLGGSGKYVRLGESTDGRHPVAFAQQDGIDFGAIAIPPSLNHLVRGTIPVWGGPTAVGQASSGDSLVVYGYGSTACNECLLHRTPADQGRVGIELDDGPHATTGTGDSGGLVAVGEVGPDGQLRGTLAYGIISGPAYGGRVGWDGTASADLPQVRLTKLATGQDAVSALLGFRPELVPGERRDSLPAVGPLEPQQSAKSVFGPFIGPGSQLVMHAEPGAPPPGPAASDGEAVGAGCTANWVWKDQHGAVYLGAAGHCFTRKSSDLSKVHVYACRATCPLGGVSGLVASQSGVGDWAELGPIAYARANGLGDDFGLVRVAGPLLDVLDPSLASWGGPVGAADEPQNGDAAVFHGNAGLVAETVATKARAGTFVASDDSSFTTTVLGSEGDSGGPVGRLRVVDGVPVVEAAGIVTHAVCKVVVGDSFTHCEAGVQAAGTTIPKAIAMAKEAGLCIRLVLQGEDPASTPAAEDCLAPPVPECRPGPDPGGEGLCCRPETPGHPPCARDHSGEADVQVAPVAEDADPSPVGSFPWPLFAGTVE